MRTIWKKINEIKAFVKAYGISQCDDRKCVWDEKFIKIERFLALWIDRKEKEGNSVKTSEQTTSDVYFFVGVTSMPPVDE